MKGNTSDIRYIPFSISAIFNNHSTKGFDFFLQTKTLEQYIDNYATGLWYKTTNNLVILGPVYEQTHDMSTMMRIYPKMVWFLIIMIMLMVAIVAFILNYFEGFHIKIIKIDK